MMRPGKMACTALSALALAGGITYASFIRGGYAKGRREYASMADMYTSPPAETEENKENEEAPSRDALPVKETQKDAISGEKTIWQVLTADLPGDAPKRLEIDWEGLLAENKDVVGWISVPAAKISYPVVQTDDNEFYLHRGIGGEYLFAGCIFMDAYNSASLMGYNTIIYGHNMRDGSMFAALKAFQNEETLQNCRYFWLQTPSSDNLYVISSVHPAAPGSDTYMLRFDTNEAHEEWLRKMSDLSAPETGVTTASEDRIVTLSTCTQDASVRMTVQGKLIYRRER